MIQDKVAHLPQSPGVYQFLDAGGAVLYVGKAKRLRNRVRSYFQDSRGQDGRIRVMISKIADLEVIVTDSEAEALILENNLIKRLQPRYNIMYRDDKSYPYICLTQEDRPRVFPTRIVERDGSRYFGPYDHVGHMRRMLDTVRKTFGLCTCSVTSRNADRGKGGPRWHSCFDDYLQNCSGDWDLEIYQSVMQDVEKLLNGKTTELLRSLREQMDLASKSLAFEEAARLRDAIESIQRFNKKMKMVAGQQVNRDLFALSVDLEIGEACGVLFKIREGKLIGTFHRFLKNIGESTQGEMLQSFMEDYYTGQFAGAIPDEVYASHDLPDPDPLAAYLWQELGKKVPLHTPQIGEKKQLIRLAQSNARRILDERRIEKEKAAKERIPQAIKDLKKYLRLERLPRRIECFDNSNLQGTDPVASMVSFVDAKPRKSEYKRFHIREVVGPDDYASMREVLTRRYKRVVEERLQPPDLILVDGGRGQLSAAIEALDSVGILEDVEVAGLAKRLEEVFLPGRQESVMLPKTSGALKLLQQARDEAHRFAVAFHQSSRSGRTLRTMLTEIPGIGEKRATDLLRKFGSVKKIAEASLEELIVAAGSKTGESVYRYLKESRDRTPGSD